jgi:hypothetical protein
MRREAAFTIARNQPIVTRIKEIKVEHPFWGYRRMWAYLKYVDNLEINKKRVLRLMQGHDLLVKADIKRKAARTAGSSKPKPDFPNQWWSTDMTKAMVRGVWVDVHHGGIRLVYEEDSRLLCLHAIPRETLAGSP